MSDSSSNFVQQYGPWAIVAGASEGTGRAFAKQLAARGLHCILIARRQAPLDKLAAEIAAEGGPACVTASIDLSLPDALQRILEVVGEREVGLYVANAGADTHNTLFLSRPIEDWLDLVRRNVMLSLQVCHHFGGQMQARGRGGLLMVNSGACYGGGPALAAYSGSKAFDLCFTESLWAELRHANVHVLSLVLGMTKTPAFQATLDKAGLPMPAEAADPDEVAAFGLARLAHGPVQNWGAAEDETGSATLSAAERRERILAIEARTRAMFAN